MCDRSRDTCLMNGRNLLTMACSGLALLAVAGCAREAPQGSIKDTISDEAPRPATRVRGYEKRAVPKRPDRSAATDSEVKPTAAKVDVEPAAVSEAPPPAPAVNGASEPPRIVNAPRAPEPPRAVNPPAAKATEPPVREAAAGNVAGPGNAVGGINSSGSLTQRIMEQARQRIAVGDVIRAREWLLSAMNSARPEVLHELARTFDPNFLSRISQANAVAEPARARALYEEAVRLGAKGASDDLNALLKAAPQP